MRLLKIQNLFLVLPLLPAAIFAAAGCASKAQINEPVAKAQPSPEAATPDKKIKPCPTEPIYSVIPGKKSDYENMKAAWQQVTAGGQYRLACDSDGDFALDSAEPKTPESYSIDRQPRSITNWGNWNYPKRPDEEHLAAIVVDTARNSSDPERFGLVILSPPEAKKNSYDVNWLYRNRDLSRTSVGMSSGSVWVQDFTPDGKRSLCWIVWNRSRKLFECKNTSRLAR